MGWPAIQGYKDGEEVVRDVLNRPLNQLAQRTEYLRNLLLENDRAKVTVAASFVGEMPRKGTPVYRTGTDGAYAVASADVGHDEWFYAAQGAMVVGVVGATVNPAPGTPETSTSSETYVVLYGKLDFAANELKASDIIVDANPTTGRYFLATEPGKLTRQPNGPVIYVANVIIDASGYVTSMLVSPQYRDTGESHVHRELKLSGLPMGGRAKKAAGIFTAEDIYPDGVTANPTARMQVLGTWTSPETDVLLKVKAVSATAIKWSTGGGAPTTDASIEADGTFKVGTEAYGDVRVKITGTPSNQSWTVHLPEAGRAWVTHEDGFALNLGFYKGTGLVPPVPKNAAALVVDGLEFRSAVHGDDAQWRFETPDPDNPLPPGGPWLIWIGNEVVADSVTTPFRNAWTSTETGVKDVESRHLAFHTNRMMVGPTGFVTSLQVEPGSPLRITDALSGAGALQGALMLGLALDFDTVAHGVAGSEVVKRITGSKFETGPVVERVLAGPGVSVSPDGGQGTVTVSVGNARYAGDFETITLKNAKQDVAGGIFPYTKLLPWPATGAVQSGFTAKFRVPDYLPEGKYNVVVSASVFGEAAVETGGTQIAAFALRSYILPDYSLAPTSEADPGHIDQATPGHAEVITVDFTDYTAFDPILVHGMASLPDVTGPRQYRSGLLLKAENGTDLAVVRPGYFVGLEIARQGLTGGSAVPYVSALGFLSLRWNLVQVPEEV